MPRLISILILLVITILCGSIFAANNASVPQSLSKMPLAYTKNMGQWDDRVLFRTTSGGATMWFTKDGITYQFIRRVNTSASADPFDSFESHPREGGNPGSFGDTDTRHTREGGNPGSFSDTDTRHSREGGNPESFGAGEVGQNRFGFDAPFSPLERGPRGVSSPDSIDQLVITAKFVNANPNPEIVAAGLLEYKCNYFLGNDPTKWHTNVPNYESIILKDIYPGIDLKFSGDVNNQASYEFIAAPNADLAQIKITYDGADSTSLNSEGNQILSTKWGDMKSSLVSSRLGLLSGKCSLSWDCDTRASSATTKEPSTRGVQLVFSTFLGGESADFGSGIATDRDGNSYTTGLTYSPDFPERQAIQHVPDSLRASAYIAKFSPTGTLIFSTCLGGQGDDGGASIAVTDGGDVYVTGVTSSGDFPTRNAFQSIVRGATNAFVVRMVSSGDSLVYSTYLGGEGMDRGTSIAVSSDGCAYVTGTAYSTNFPTDNAIQSIFQGGSRDAFVAKFSPDGSDLIFSTYLGGNDRDDGRGIGVDSMGYVYVAGITTSTNFPTMNPVQSFNRGYSDVFVVKLDGDGSDLIYGTYLGGSDNDEPWALAIDLGGHAYVTGYTYSWDFPIQNPFQWGPRIVDAFVTKLCSTGDSLEYSTFLGGESHDVGFGIAVDQDQNAYVTGQTWSWDFPVENPLSWYGSIYNAFVTKLNSTGNQLIYSTHLGGSGEDLGSGIAVDRQGNVYVTGHTQSFDFPTLNPFQGSHHPYSEETFVTKFAGFPPQNCGDANADASVNIADAVYLICYIFLDCTSASTSADADCDGSITIADAVYLVNYIFLSGPAPCASCK